MSIAAVAREMGYTAKYVGDLLSDPTGEEARKRLKKHYEANLGECPRCGTTISPKAETCSKCSDRHIAVTDSPIVNGCYDRRPPCKRCAGCGNLKDKEDFNTKKIAVAGSSIKALHLKPKCKLCQRDENQAAEFRKLLKHGRISRRIFIREFEKSDNWWRAHGNLEVSQHKGGTKGTTQVIYKIGGKTFRQALCEKAEISEKRLWRIEKGRFTERKNGTEYKHTVTSVDIAAMEAVLAIRHLELRDLPEWEWVVEEGPNRTLIGDSKNFREEKLYTPSRRQRIRVKQKARRQASSTHSAE